MNAHSACSFLGFSPIFHKTGLRILGEDAALKQRVPARERVVAAARRLFSERGFHRTAMADLAEDADVSVGTIYRSFASKSDIIRAIIQSDTEETLAGLQSCIDRVRNGSLSGNDAVEQLVKTWLSKRTDPLSHEIVAEAHRNQEVAQLVSLICCQFRALLRDLASLLKSGLSEVEIEGVAEILLACLFGMGNREFTAPRLDEAHTAAVVTRILLQGARA